MNIDTRQEIILENNRVKLEPLSMSHYPILLAFSTNEPTLWRYSMQQPNTPENLQIYITTALNSRAAGVGYPFIVYDKKRQLYAGSTRFYQIDTYHKIVSLGYTWYGRCCV